MTTIPGAVSLLLNLIDAKLRAIDEMDPDRVWTGGFGSGRGGGRVDGRGGYGFRSFRRFSFRLLENGFD